MFLAVDSDLSSQDLSADETKQEQVVTKFDTKNLDKQKFARQATIFKLDGSVNKVDQDLTLAEISEFIVKT